jgi:cytoplasmic iron level regulating protein YaaA (DUF328/UPF0246 family)
MKTLCIVPCGHQKIWHKNPNAGPTAAKDVYTGVFARKCQEYALKFYPDSYCILSAKHGFLLPDDIIPEDYNVTFKNPKTHPIGLPQLIEIARAKHLYDYDEIVVIAGREYSKMIRSVFKDKSIRDPLCDCAGMGVMMGKINGAIIRNRPF